MAATSETSMAGTLSTCNMQMRFLMEMVVVLLLVCISSSCAARNPVRLLSEKALDSRELLASKAGNPAVKAITYSKTTVDPNKDCANKYSKVNYNPVTSVCSSKVHATKACCAAFNQFACQFRSEVNNFNTVCPIMFMSYLNYAGGFKDGYFVGPCVDGTKGLCV